MIFGTCLVVIKEVKEFFPQNFKMKCLEEAYIKLVREGDGGLVHLSPATCLAHTLFFLVCFTHTQSHYMGEDLELLWLQ